MGWFLELTFCGMLVYILFFMQILETFIEPQRFRGTCYRTANWGVLWATTERGKYDQTHEPNRSIEEVLDYPLVKDFRVRISQVSE